MVDVQAHLLSDVSLTCLHTVLGAYQMHLYMNHYPCRIVTVLCRGWYWLAPHQHRPSQEQVAITSSEAD